MGSQNHLMFDKLFPIDEDRQKYMYMWVVVKIMVLFGTQKGTIILITTHVHVSWDFFKLTVVVEASMRMPEAKSKSWLCRNMNLEWSSTQKVPVPT